VRLLIDSHVVIWWWTERASLSATAMALLTDRSSVVAVSAASAWEIGTKHRLGKLPQLDARFSDLPAQFISEVAQDGFDLLPITAEHGLRAGTYKGGHRDPFDRLLAAQAELERMILITRDAAFADFPCERLW